jgi:hypothetical protein
MWSLSYGCLIRFIFFVIFKTFMPANPFESDMTPMLGGAEKPRSRMLSPGYYSQECNAHKPCDKGKRSKLSQTFNSTINCENGFEVF